MKTEPITSQPNFKGKIIFEKGTTNSITKFVPDPLWYKYKTISKLISDKPYDLFISINKQNPDFYDIAANKSFEEAKNVKEYTVKVKSNSLVESVVDAAKEAMDMYEKFIAKSMKG